MARSIALPAIPLLEGAVHLLRRASRTTLVCNLVGAAPDGVGPVTGRHFDAVLSEDRIPGVEFWSFGIEDEAVEIKNERADHGSRLATKRFERT